jgi:hypothetical protein
MKRVVKRCVRVLEDCVILVPLLLPLYALAATILFRGIQEANRSNHDSESIIASEMRGIIGKVSGFVDKAIGNAPFSRADCVGAYSRKDTFGNKLAVFLMPDGIYKAQWRGWRGVDGVAIGRWTVTNCGLRLEPVYETGAVKGRLREMWLLVAHNGPVILFGGPEFTVPVAVRSIDHPGLGGTKIKDSLIIRQVATLENDRSKATTDR